ncbi:MAG: DAK2 domain-containing protein [Firmicutes bacterium]|nr:DAK2 domain-containing protein [Bacillota bacterium]
MLKKMIIAGANKLGENKQLVDSLNVFPVPDGDTGTNMSLTALSAASETEKGESSKIGDIAKLSASGALRGARGNSGVILSQLIRGFSKGLVDVESADVHTLAAASRKGVETAYKAVMKPKEGTILTVARACADAAEEAAKQTNDIEKFLKIVIDRGYEMLDKTPDMLPVLKQAGVVDAGGKGLLCILEGAFESINSNEEIKLNETSELKKPVISNIVVDENSDIEFGYCTEFFILNKDTSDEVLDDLKEFLLGIGDSLVVVADDEVVKVHVHTNHPGQAIEKALTIGALNGLKIDNMRIQHNETIQYEKTDVVVKDEGPRKEHGFVSVSMGDGIEEIFKNLGVDVVVSGGQTMNPSTEDILNAVAKVNADNVFILPNNKNIILASEQAAKIVEDKKLYVVPTTSVPEGLEALINYDASQSADDAFETMKDSLSLVKTLMVTYAVRDTVFGENTITEGDILCMLGGKIEVVSKEIKDGTCQLIDKAVDEDSEMISIYYGSDVTEEDAQEIAAYVEETYPDCEVEVVSGGQPLYYYIISVE